MSDKTHSITIADAERFAARYGLTRLKAEDMPALAKGMETIWRGGLAITRPPSKLAMPAFAFDVPVRLRKTSV